MSAIIMISCASRLLVKSGLVEPRLKDRSLPETLAVVMGILASASTQRRQCS